MAYINNRQAAAAATATSSDAAGPSNNGEGQQCVEHALFRWPLMLCRVAVVVSIALCAGSSPCAIHPPCLSSLAFVACASVLYLFTSLDYMIMYADTPASSSPTAAAGGNSLPAQDAARSSREKRRDQDQNPRARRASAGGRSSGGRDQVCCGLQYV